MHIHFVLQKNHKHFTTEKYITQHTARSVSNSLVYASTMFKPVQSSGSYSAIWSWYIYACWMVCCISYSKKVTCQASDIQNVKADPLRTVYLPSYCSAMIQYPSTSIFQVNLGSPVPPCFSSSTCHGREPLRVSDTGILQAGCPSCHPT